MSATPNSMLSSDISLSIDHVKQWYALYIFSNHEKRVQQHLQMKGVEVFLPLHTVVKRWKNRTTAKIQIPLFPGYIFTRFRPEQRTRILETTGVVSLVTVAGKSVPLPEEEIETLRTGLHLRQTEPYPYLNVGARARIRSGPLAGLEGIVVRKDNRLRVVLSIELIKRSVAVYVDGHELEALDDSPKRAAIIEFR